MLSLTGLMALGLLASIFFGLFDKSLPQCLKGAPAGAFASWLASEGEGSLARAERSALALASWRLGGARGGKGKAGRL